MTKVFLILTALSFCSLGRAEVSKQIFCKDKSLKMAKSILKNEGESISSTRIKSESSISVTGEGYKDEIFDISLKTKNAERCVTLKYSGTKTSCTLVSYRYPGCH